MKESLPRRNRIWLISSTSMSNVSDLDRISLMPDANAEVDDDEQFEGEGEVEEEEEIVE